jgi:hypothetical protein
MDGTKLEFPEEGADFGFGPRTVQTLSEIEKAGNAPSELPYLPGIQLIGVQVNDRRAPLPV